MGAPLADKIRPLTLDDVVGQEHLLGKEKVLRRMVETGNIPNLIFYGPSGVGKTTVASIIAKQAGKKLYKLNGTTASTADIKDVVGQLDTFDGMGGVLLYLDEIQYLNKKQQQTLLEFIENGSITLIASTTENPYFYVYNAILSRSTVFEFRPVSPQEIKKAVERAFRIAGESLQQPLEIEDGVQEHIAYACGGDVRKAVNAVEMLSLAAVDAKVTLEEAKQVAQKSAMRYDRDGDVHYDILSAFQKAVRGSDENAALHYLARLLEAGDLISPCRRMLVMASEDVGLAYPMAAAIVKACVDSAFQLGLPEAQIPLAQAVILMCTSPKSNSAVLAIDAAMADVKNGVTGEIPPYLRDGHYSGAQKMGHAIGYKYAHDYPNHYVQQQYLPDPLKDKKYYHFGENKTEQAAKAYWEKIKGENL
ncbi:replication-associated recombination protein A [Youxingia wuxianensis]|uniref:Replication-associated recombination protein A n=1 Tax=Youxingia wuxianensis TaxID=2763678 RepID=A0A926END6_9FIRM|nr:replication-associated recombination protein A [Youxingia wuxianensis]MBC8584417.1 replication-associated recombination protein A [Youxingia wuxianensis]